MKDLLKTSSNERIDIGDFNYVAVDSASDQVNELTHNFLVNPNGADRFILSGFAMTNPSGNQVRVNQGTAIIHQRRDGQIVESVLSTTGDTYKIIDISTYPSNTYNIYIRFEHVQGDEQGRIFWNPSGTGSEYTQTVPTRYLANWSVRIESSSPGQEWYRIGQVVMPSMSITDLRDFYFEGSINDSYESGWSTEGGGSSTDRNSNRAIYGIIDLHTFVSATKQSIEDIRGRGLRSWYEKGIGGMNIGFDDDPVEGALYINNTGFGLTSSSTGVYRTLKFTDTTYFRYSTTSSNLSFRFDSDERILVDSTGITFNRAVLIEADSGYNALIAQGKGSTSAIIGTGEAGQDGNGVEGIATGTGYGLYGLSSTDTGSYGVLGVGYSNIGIYATSTGSYAAIEGHGGGHGIKGFASGTNHGIFGTGGSSGGAGVYGVASSASGYGVYGAGLTTGPGVYAKGGSDGAALRLFPNVSSISSPQNGDIWMYGTNLFVKIAGQVYTVDLTVYP